MSGGEETMTEEEIGRVRSGVLNALEPAFPPAREILNDFLAVVHSHEVLRTERNAAEGALKGVSGALADAATVKVPANPMGYGDAVRELTKERDALRNDLADARSLLAEFTDITEKPPRYRERIEEFLYRAKSPTHEFVATIEERTKERDALRGLLEECGARISGRSGPGILHSHYTVGDSNFDTPLLARIDALLPKEDSHADR